MSAESPSLLTMKLPKELGGFEADLRSQFLATEAASRKDGSAGWNETFTTTSAAIVAARLPQDGLDEVAASATEGAAWPPFAGTFPLSGRTATAPGGVVLTGRWGFASGIADAAWVVGGCTTESGPRWAVVPVEQVTVYDTWQVSGLEETLNQCFRDAHAATQHVHVIDEMYEVVGATLLGEAPD